MPVKKIVPSYKCILLLLLSITGFCQTRNAADTADTSPETGPGQRSHQGAGYQQAAVAGNQPASPDRNFVRTENILIAGVTDEHAISYLDVDDKSEVYDFADGFGRPLQKVQVKQNPQYADIITPFEFDVFGRKPRNYLPYTEDHTLKGKFREDAVNQQRVFYSEPPFAVAGGMAPYNENVFENSPLCRIIGNVMPRDDYWNPTAKKSSIYVKTNVANEVMYWKYHTSGFPMRSGFYPPNQLIIEQIVNEDGQVRNVYKDQRGLVVLTRTGNPGTWFDSYRIYSPDGLLMFVIQPEGVSRLATEYEAAAADKQSFLDRWAFQYQYDNEQRLVAKRVPGAQAGPEGWTVMVYDQWNRIVLTQDPAQRSGKEYLFTKYDLFNRPVLTGIFRSAKTLPALRAEAGASTSRYETNSNTAVGYTLSVSFPTTGVNEGDIMAIYYYDRYDFLNYPGWDAEGNNFAFQNVSGYPSSTSRLMTVKGYPTGTKIRIIGQNRWLNNVTWYDKKYRPIQSIRESHLGGIIRSGRQFDFTGKIEKEITSAFSLSIQKRFTYDHAGRLRTTLQSINGAPEIIIASNEYNALGQLIEKNIHSADGGNTFLQSVDYRYNVKGWLTNINNSKLNTGWTNDDSNDLFGMDIAYYAPTPVKVSGAFTTKSLYGGNISSIRWKTDNKQETPVERIYGFDYDVLSRMKRAYTATNVNGVWNGEGGMFDESIKQYDGNGNIKGILRYGKVQGIRKNIDDLSMGYAGSNQLITVDDASGNGLGFREAAASIASEYRYDKNGNLISDHNKGISAITYNYLKLPESIEYTRSDATRDRIEYTYDGEGNKLSKVVKIKNTMAWRTDYTGGMQFENGTLAFFYTPEGRVAVNNGHYDHEYFIKDHQGNIRVGFGPLKETLNYKATMEVALAQQEDLVFKNVSARRINPGDASLNTTVASEKVLVPNRAAKCNAHLNQAIGPAKSLRVMAGDAVYMEVFARYTQPTGSNAVITAAILGAAVNAALGINGTGESAPLFNGINSNAAAAAGAIPAGNIIPKAYLVFLFFNDRYVFQRAGAVGITASAYNAFEKLSRSFTADKNGYLYIYVATESNAAAANVYFDDFSIIHQKNNTTLQVTQSGDYYPFGMIFNAYHADRLKVRTVSPEITYEPVLRNRYLFQGQELQNDL
ncbi:MAG TPA: DUF6443 domain-containing protein, partial [Ohtaekwangia sp.]|nr:DUF6443 domain-containing protein [Ohtaekwangia sp.]